MVGVVVVETSVEIAVRKISIDFDSIVDCLYFLWLYHDPGSPLLEELLSLPCLRFYEAQNTQMA